MKRVLSLFMVCILILSGCGSDEAPRTKQEVTIEEKKRSEERRVGKECGS